VLIVIIVIGKPENNSQKFIYFILCCTGEYLALTGDKLNGVEMIACRLATHYSLTAVCFSLCFHTSLFCLLRTFPLLTLFGFSCQRLPLLEERLGKLITDEPSIVETSLAQYGDLVYPGRSSVLHK